MAEYKFDKQNNYGFPFAFNATDKFPLIAKRIWGTYADALEFINDVNSTAVPGIRLSVINDSDPKKNGLYFVAKVASAKDANDGVLEKVGDGTGSIAVENYSAALSAATADNLGQIIYAKNDDESNSGATAGPYIVTGPGEVAKLGTTTATGDIAGDVNTLKGKVSAIEGWAASGISASDVENFRKAEENVQADWAESDSGKDSYILNKPVDLATTGDVATAKGEAIAEASAYTDSAINALDLANTYDAKGAAASAETAAKAYAESAITALDLANTYDVKGAAASAETAAKAYADSAITALDLANTYDAKGAAASAETAAKAYADSGLTKKVDIVEGERLMKDAEGTKLEGIESGAQVNIIEVVKVNGSALTITDKAVDVTIPSVPEYSLSKAASAETGFIATYELTKDGTSIGAKINIPKDFLVKSASVKECTVADTPESGYVVGDKYIDFVVNTVEGDESESHIYLNVKDLVDVYTGSTYVNINSGNGIEVKYDELKTQLSTDLGISDLAANSDLQALSGVVEANEEVVADALASLDTRVDELSGASHTHANADVINAISSGDVETWNAAEGNAKAYASAYTEDAISALDATISGESHGVNVEVKEENGKITEVNVVAPDFAEAYDAKGAAASAETASKAYTDEAISALTVTVSGKVDSETGKRLMTDEEGTKLGGIEGGAQVNVLEKVKFNGEELTISAKTVDVVVDGSNVKLTKDIEGAVYSAASATSVDSVLEDIFATLNGIKKESVEEFTSSDSSVTFTETSGITGSSFDVKVNTESASTETVKAGHIEIKSGANGIYGVMYYLEDDGNE